MSFRYSKRCPKCNQFAAKDHVCPMDEDHKMPGHTADGASWTENDDGAFADMKATRVVTLDDLIKACKIDLDKWYIERHVINKWEVGAKGPDGQIITKPLFQVKAWLKPLAPMGAILEEVQSAKADLLVRTMGTRTVKYDPPHWEEDPVMAEFCLFDPHFGMYAWAEETRDADYDIHIAKDLYLDHLDRLIRWSEGRYIEQIVFPIGNDGLHINGPVHGSNAGGATAAGTIMDVDSRFPKVFREKRRAVVEAVDRLSSIAPVHVVVVGGNHDPLTSFMLGEVIDAYYLDDRAVTVDNGPQPRKYHKYGNTSFLFAHGKDEKVDKLPITMMREFPDGRDCEYHEVHLGHIHKKMRGFEIDVNDDMGAMVRWLPSLAPNDAWHSKKGYIHRRSAEVLFFDREKGYAGSGVSNV